VHADHPTKTDTSTEEDQDQEAETNPSNQVHVPECAIIIQDLEIPHVIAYFHVVGKK